MDGIGMVPKQKEYNANSWRLNEKETTKALKAVRNTKKTAWLL